MGKKLKLLSSFCLVSVLLVSVLAAGCTAKPAAPTPTSTPTSAPKGAAVSFEGKTIIFVCPSTAGGGTDVATRLYAKYFAKYLPGNPTIVVRNIAGAAGTLGANHFYNAKPDGLTAGVMGGSNHVGYIMGLSANKADFLKTTPIIGVSASQAYFVRTDKVAKRDDIVKSSGLIFGHSTPMSLGGWVFVTTKELLNLPVDKVIMAYGGGSESRRAFLAGEVQITAGTTMDYANTMAPYVEKGEVIVLYQTGMLDRQGNLIKDPVYPPDVPAFWEFYEKITGKSPSGMAWEAYKGLVGVYAYDKVLQLPPGTPDSIIRAYWDAAEKILKDPEFQQIAERVQGKAAIWVTSEDLLKSYRVGLSMDPKVVQWLKDLMKTKYGVQIE